MSEPEYTERVHLDPSGADPIRDTVEGKSTSLILERAKRYDAESERDRLGNIVSEQALRIIDMERQNNELYTALEALLDVPNWRTVLGTDEFDAAEAALQARRIPTGDGSPAHREVSP